MMLDKEVGLGTLLAHPIGEQLQVSFTQTIDTVIFDLRRSVACLYLLEAKKVHYHSISRGK
jgi:hypothetical protein